MSDTIHTHYKNLSVSETSPIEVIAASFQALMEKYSAQRFPNDAEAARIRNVLEQSFAVLKSPERRREHDEWIATRTNNQSFAHSNATLPAALPTPLFAASAANDWPSPPPHQPVPRPRLVADNENTGLYIGGAIIAVIIFLIWSASTSRSTTTTTPSAVPVTSTDQSAPPSRTATAGAPQSTVSPPAAAPTKVFAPDYGTAAITANFRDGPSAKSKIIRTLARGTMVERVSLDGTFVAVRLADGAMGWIAEELLLTHEQILRLSTQSAEGYRADRASENRLRELDAGIASSKKQRIDSLFGVLNAAWFDRASALNEMASVAVVAVATPAADEAAATWFTLAATAARNAVNVADALPNYAAAAEAAPGNGNHHSAVALAAYELQNNGVLLASAYRALALSPETTNACLVFALALASTSTPQQPRDRAATNMFRLAVHYSRDGEFTKRYLRSVATKASNPVVARAITQALTQ